MAGLVSVMVVSGVRLYADGLADALRADARLEVFEILAG